MKTSILLIISRKKKFVKHIDKKILFFLPSFGGGGAEQVFIRLLNYLTKKKFKTSVFINRNKGEHLGRLHKDVKSHYSLIERLPFAVLQFIIHAWVKRPDIIYVTLTYPLAVIGMLRGLFPKSTIMVGRVTNLYSEELKNIKSSFIKWVLPSALNNFDKIICQSTDMKEDLIKSVNFSNKTIHVINNPIPENDFKNFERKGFICVGRLSKQKNYELVIKAFSSMSEELTIYGIGPEQQNLLNLAKKLNCKNIKFKGFSNNVLEEISRSKALIVSSNFEGFSNVIVEALSCGTPIISKDFLGGKNEVLNPKNSISFGTNDPKDLINAVKSFNSKIFEHRLIAIEAQKKYGIDKIGAQYLSLIE